MTTPRQPETLGQAPSFDQVVKLGHDAGLCYGCAAQLAWGVQGGFSTVRPPCGDCAKVVETWAVQRPNGWRTPTGTLSRSPSWPGFTSGRRTGPGNGRPLRRASTVDEEHLARDGGV